MLISAKALLVVLVLGIAVFAFAKSTSLLFMDESDFRRRRNVWLTLSIAAFLSPNFWLFALVAAPALYWGGKKDTNPMAFYLALMNVIPSIPIPIPTHGLGINQLFDLDIFRLLSLCVLVPAAWRVHKSTDPNRIHGLRGMDFLLIAYGILTVLLYVPPDVSSQAYQHTSTTNVLRETVLYTIDVYALYYVASRSCSSRRAILDAFAAFCLSCTIMATVAVFESVKHWLLYVDLYARWGGDLMNTAYLVRAGLLRAVASSGNALALGYLLAIALGLWICLQSHLTKIGPRIAVAAVLWLGLLASFSRGPMLGALLIYLAYVATRAGSMSRLIKSAALALVVIAATLASPLGDPIMKTLPFMGGDVATGSLDYRKVVLARSWDLIQAHPFFGDQLAFTHLQDLRQGQGIIDLVNTYVGVTVFHGLIGLMIFLAFFLSGLLKAYAAARRTPRPYPDWVLVGASLTGCMVGTLLMLADCSFILGYATMFFVLAGVAVAYSRVTELAATDMTLARSPATPQLG
jgi:hypothetical protein